MIPFFDLMMATQVVQNPASGGSSEEDLVLDLAEAYQIPQGTGEDIQGNIVMSIPDDATDHGVLGGSQQITSGNVSSLHLVRTSTDFQVSSSGKMKLVVMVNAGGGATDAKFKVWQSTTADSASGSTVYDFNGTELDASEPFTTPVLNFTVTVNDYINVEYVSGASNITVTAWFVEFPSV